MDFLHALPAALRRSGVNMVTPSELAKRKPVGQLSFPNATSWADTERDVSAWLGNALQHAAHARLYGLRDAVLSSGHNDLISAWRQLSTSDHFYYMSTKWHADGDVHTYFSPYANPYDAYISFMNVMRDIEQRVGLGSSQRKTTVGRLEAAGRRTATAKPKTADRRNGKAETASRRSSRPKIADRGNGKAKTADRSKKAKARKK
jgi:alpha-amylase/alpha-mannosidase (GH57 family)